MTVFDASKSRRRDPVRDRGPVRFRGRRAAWAVVVPVLYLALAVLLFRRAWAAPATLSIGNSSDPPQFMWFLSWVPFALTHGQNPLLSSYLDYPGGVNLMWNTSIILPSAVLAPLTLRWGPVVAYNLLITLAPALSGWAAYLAVRRFVDSSLAAAVGGLLYGFSPFMLTEALAHPQMALAPAPPLVLLLGHELLCGRRWSAPTVGGALGVLAAGQLLSGEELLATTALVTLVAVLILWVVCGRRARAQVAWRRLAGAGITMVGVFALLAAAPLATQFAGPQGVHGALHTDPATRYVTDLLAPIAPSPRQWIAPPAAVALSARFQASTNEQTGYLGLPLALLLSGAVALWWRRAVVRWAGLVALVVTLLSCGPRLEVAGRVTAIPLPWALLERLPMLRPALPCRLMVFVDLMAALLLALVLTYLPRLTRPGTWAGGGAVGAALLFALPTPAYPVAAVQVPVFFQGPLLSRVPAGSVALVAPFAAPYHNRYHDGPYSRAMLWQANGGMRFRMPEGYAFAPQTAETAALHPPASALQTAMVTIQQGARLSSGSAGARRALTHDIHAWRVRTIIVGPMGNRRAMIVFMGRLLGRAPVYVGGVAVWWRV